MSILLCLIVRKTQQKVDTYNNVNNGPNSLNLGGSVIIVCSSEVLSVVLVCGNE